MRLAAVIGVAILAMAGADTITSRIVDAMETDQVTMEEAALYLMYSVYDIDAIPSEYTDGAVYVRFDPLGASAYHTIRLVHTQFEREFVIEVLPLTGEIRFHDGATFRERLAPDDNDFQ